MRDILDNLVAQMVPYVNDLEKCYDLLKEKENKLYQLNELHHLIEEDPLNYLNYNQDLLNEMLDGFNSNLDEYNAYKYILSSTSNSVKELPQYKEALTYLNDLCQYTNDYYDNYLQEYEDLCQKQKLNELVKKYYDMFNNNDIFVDNPDELNNIFETFNIDIDQKIDLVIYILKENNNLTSKGERPPKEYDEEELQNVVKKNSKFLNDNYKELLNVVNGYIDLTKPLKETMNDDLINKINISNILLAKKVWLLQNGELCLSRKNYVKAKQYLDEFSLVSELLERVKNIKDNEKVLGIIKGELNEE